MKGIFRFFGRLLNLIGITANDALDQLEKPERMLKEKIDKARNAQAQLGKAYATAQANLMLQQDYVAQYKKKSSEYRDKAKQALNHGRKDLAEEAISRKMEFDSKIESQKERLLLMQQQVNTLKKQKEQTNDMVQKAIAEQRDLSVQLRAARAQKEIAEMISGVDHQSLTADIQNLTDDVKLMQNTAHAMIEETSKENGDELDKQLSELGSDTKVKNEIEDIMKEIEEEKKSK